MTPQDTCLASPAHNILLLLWQSNDITMPRQLTPEELKIIRQSEKEGERLARQQEGASTPSAWRRASALIVFALVFILIVGLAYLIVSSTAA